jgi:hypothetical protein
MPTSLPLAFNVGNLNWKLVHFIRNYWLCLGLQESCSFRGVGWIGNGQKGFGIVKT